MVANKQEMRNDRLEAAGLEPWLVVEDVMELTRFSRRRVLALARAGLLPGIRHAGQGWWFKQSQVAEFMRKVESGEIDLAAGHRRRYQTRAASGLHRKGAGRRPTASLEMPSSS